MSIRILIRISSVVTALLNDKNPNIRICNISMIEIYFYYIILHHEWSEETFHNTYYFIQTNILLFRGDEPFRLPRTVLPYNDRL